MWRSIPSAGVLFFTIFERIGTSEASISDISCMPLNSGANYVQGSPVIALRNGSWTQATVVNIQAGVYVITWTDTGLTTSEPASALRQADLCNCFVNRGTCAQYALNNRGITCNCAWSQNLGNICAPWHCAQQTTSLPQKWPASPRPPPQHPHPSPWEPELAEGSGAWSCSAASALRFACASAAGPRSPAINQNAARPRTAAVS